MKGNSRLLVVLLLPILAAACAGPQLQIPRASPASVAVERQRQLALLRDQQDFALRQQLEKWRRVYSVYSRLRTGSADLCKSDVSPFWGLWLADLSTFPAEEPERAKRVLNLDYEISVLAAAGNAAAAGIRAGDVISKIDGIELQPRFIYTQRSYIGNALKVLEKAGMKPVEFEIIRAGEKFSTVISPEFGCRYPLRIENSPAVNAFADGNLIAITTGMLELANNDDELAHVISHELAHNVLGHLARTKANIAVGQILGAVLDIGLLLGARVDTGGALGQTGAKVGRLVYSKEFEREADYMSLYFMVRGGFDATKAPDMHRKLAANQPASINYGVTHPTSPERSANLEMALQEVAGKIVKNEPLVPTRLEGEEASAVASTTLDAQKVLQQQAMLEQRRQNAPAVSVLKPIEPKKKPEPVRRFAIIMHIKGKNVSIPPMVLQAEYIDAGEGSGTSRVIFPGNYILEGEFLILPSDQSFKGVVNARLLDPDTLEGSTITNRKGFATYSSSDGILLECVFFLSNRDRIERGLCLDNRGNQYRITD